MPKLRRLGAAQTDFITTPVYGSNGSRAYPNQKAIAVGSDGFVRFVIGDSSPGGASDEITYARCLDEDCVTSITATFATGEFTFDYSIALGPDGFARIAYSTFGWATRPPGHDGFHGFIQCADDDCVSFSNTVVDGASDVRNSDIQVRLNKGSGQHCLFCVKCAPSARLPPPCTGSIMQTV